MTVTFGTITFDKVSFDTDADVLYLAVEGAQAAHWQESPEGHVLRFDEDGNLMGVTIIDVHEHLEDGVGNINITVPKRVELELRDLALA